MPSPSKSPLATNRGESAGVLAASVAAGLSMQSWVRWWSPEGAEAAEEIARHHREELVIGRRIVGARGTRRVDDARARPAPHVRYRSGEGKADILQFRRRREDQVDVARCVAGIQIGGAVAVRVGRDEAVGLAPTCGIGISRGNGHGHGAAGRGRSRSKGRRESCRPRRARPGLHHGRRSNPSPRCSRRSSIRLRH